MYFNEERKSTNIDDEFGEKKKINISKKSLIIIGIILVLLLIFGIYILIPKEPPIEYFLNLNGSNDVVIYQNMEYVDAGYMAYDNKGNNYEQDVVIDGSVNTDVVGEYKIKYSFNGLEETRTVTVLAKSQQLTFLVLLGDKTIYLKRGEQYQEPGYNVIDSLDTNLKDKVKIIGEVNSNEIGTYKLKYSVVNQLGIEFSEERTVIVLGADVNISYSPEVITGEKVIINIGISDNYFDYIIFPDGIKKYQRYDEYEVTQNGVYKFLIYSKDGSYQEKSIEINNIDKEAPKGSCSGYYKSGKSYITVNATDNMSQISKYVFNNQTFQKNTFTINGEFSTISLMVYDSVGNGANISCQLTNNNPVVKPSSSSQGKSSSSGGMSNYVKCTDNTKYLGTKYNLTQAQKEKLAAMIYAEDAYTWEGMQAVASHMGNLYEGRKFRDSSMKSSFYEYISNTTWYAERTRKMVYDSSNSVMRKALEAVELVVVQGNRTLPLYIDEFDTFPKDVVSPLDKSQYVQGKTVYLNIYGDQYDTITFYCFSVGSNEAPGNIYGYSVWNEKYKNYLGY